MKSITFILISLFSFKSCLNDKPVVHVLMNDANGLEVGNKVTCKGLAVGKVNQLKIVGNQIVATVELNDDFKASKGSVAQVDIDNIFGKKSLVILPSNQTEFLANGDTIYALTGNKLSILENLVKSGNLDSLIKDINIKDLNLDSLNINIDSSDLNGLLKKAEKLMDWNKLLQ